MIAHTGSDELPIEIECFLLNMGFLKATRPPGYKPTSQVHIPEETKKYRAWKPSYHGEEPPF